ncbi:glucan endo-1,3-alpha-glucosidase agn1 [Aspergillus udagawae]|uniref:Glucan endo-1,3-alpha-glucosidase agn1 n=1 Tax=Aspergillus udagawae TaxID=91492 RepID=A0A8H3NAU9_9EURO|nr:glucan endo-1,3-alpha-glucosidase agn1 [Aspergillus udagawae]
MIYSTWLALVVASQVIRLVHAKAVFAHFMVTNSQNYTAADWESDMKLAKDAHIDAFAMNMAWKDSTNDPSLEMAFNAANSVGFKLFFSFDYAGNGPWSQDTVIHMIQQYGSNGAYFQYKGKPFVSTFEGPGNAEDWVDIKAQTGCFFIPDWSSVGAKPAAALANGVADGLFSWSAWPWGNQTMDTYTDASYIQYLKGKPYMMAISPWFYTNLMGYNKNWLWKGDRLWFDRWQELLGLDPMPEFVEIISWNDYGESHYIGPLYGKAMAAFDIGKSIYNYASDYPHDGWRDVLPFLIDLYKNGQAGIDHDTVVFWYRPHPVSACFTGGTTVNTASQLQIEFEPASALEDRVYVMALLSNGNHAVRVYAGGDHGYVKWETRPDAEIGTGIFFGSVPFYPGKVGVELYRGDSEIGSAVGLEISNRCEEGFNNYNAWVGSFTGTGMGTEGNTGVALKDQACIRGKGAYDFNDLCNFTCSYGYCPVGACTCEQMGVPRTKPNATGVIGYPAEGRDANYLGLCSFACNYGHCPSKTCDTQEHPMPVPTVSDFLPPACTEGTGNGSSIGLCSYACGFGYCPINLCKCTKTGALVEPPPQTKGAGMAAAGMSDVLNNLCDFTCSRGYCPPETCMYKDELAVANIKPILRWGGQGAAICGDTQKMMILLEFRFAILMAQTAQDNLQSYGFYDTFFSQGVRNRQGFAQQASGVYQRVASMLDGSSGNSGPSYELKITCDFNADPCKKAQNPDIAHMNPGKFTVNICPRFFSDPGITATTDKYAHPPASIIDAHHTRASVLLHEMTHSKYAMKTTSGLKTQDYAYGWESCKLLAEGTFDRGCQAYKGLKGNLCADSKDPTKDGVCNADFSAQNADTWAVIAAGIFFSHETGRQIPLYPPTPVSARAVSGLSARAGCVRHDDIMFDSGSGFEINGLVSFGDSFAAGMGTAETTRDKCRVGGNNYGDLIHRHLGDDTLSIEKKVCSGDTTIGLQRQIGEWTGSSPANLGTLTMGGNDLGFSDIVWYCIVTPLTWIPSSWNRAHCTAAKDKARALMNDEGESGLRYKLKTLYKSILNKAEDHDFALIVTGYTGFFNHDTTDCDQSTFHYLWAGYNPPSDGFADRIVYLTTSLRTELNGLVGQLNNLIEAAVQDANSELGSTNVHYVDVQSNFDSHRWCEQGIHEPDASAPNTYFFLSGWTDFPLDNTAVTSSDPADIASLMQTGVNLPEASNCQQAIGSDPDPYEKFLCLASIAINQDPNGPVAWSYNNATQAIKDGNVNSQHVSDWSPTRQIKTFHPRSPGMGLYRDAILQKIDAIMDN